MDIKSVSIDDLDVSLAALCTSQSGRIGWSKPEGYFEGRLAQQEAGELRMFVAHAGETYAGHVFLNYRSDYAGFADNGIPEIQDLAVLPDFRNLGLGNALVAHCENLAAERYDVVGIGVGLYADYGAAQRIYTKRGYVPDGRGMHYDGKPCIPGESYRVDDELILYLTRSLV